MADAVHDAKRLAELQALPLERKILITQTRIIEWYTHFNGKVCVSFSGGKDSTVLLHIARGIYPDIPVVFANTGLEYPEIVRFAHKQNVDVVRPKIRFDEVIRTYGYPLIGKEVAEAIYYARRIRERERERETENEHHIQTSGAGNRRTVLMGKMPLDTHEQRSASELNFKGNAHGGREPQPTAKNRGSLEVDRRRNDFEGKWQNYHRRSLKPDFNNPIDREAFFDRTVEYDDWRRGCL